MSNFKDTVYSILTEDATDRAAAGVKAQVDKERERQAAFPVREVGIASPSSQIGGAGTQYGNSPNRAPETPYDPAKEEEERIKIKNQVNDIIIKNAKQKEAESTPEKRKKIDNDQRAKNGLPPISDDDFNIVDARREAADETAKKKKKFADDFSDEMDQTTEEYKTNGQVAAESLKAKNDEQAAKRRAKRDAHHDSEQSATYQRGSNGVQVRDRPGSRGSSSGGFSVGSNGSQNPTPRNPKATQGSEYTSTVTSSTPSVSLQTGPRDQSRLIAAYSAIRSKNKNPAMQTAGYSYNKALTFFAEQLKRKYIEEEGANYEQF